MADYLHVDNVYQELWCNVHILLHTLWAIMICSESVKYTDISYV